MAIQNFLRSDCEYALLTSHDGWIRNDDIRTGGWRYLDLKRMPFLFDEPEERLADYHKGKDFPRYVGLWHRATLERQIQPLLANIELFKQC